MLYTNLNHLETAADQTRVISENRNVMIVCGRMDPASVAVYRIAEKLQKKYTQVKFFDMEFDNPESDLLKSLLKCISIREIPVTGFFKEGKLTNVFIGLLKPEQLNFLLNKEFMINFKLIN